MEQIFQVLQVNFYHNVLGARKLKSKSIAGDIDRSGFIWDQYETKWFIFMPKIYFFYHSHFAVFSTLMSWCCVHSIKPVERTMLGPRYNTLISFSYTFWRPVFDVSLPANHIKDLAWKVRKLIFQTLIIHTFTW